MGALVRIRSGLASWSCPPGSSPSAARVRWQHTGLREALRNTEEALGQLVDSGRSGHAGWAARRRTWRRLASLERRLLAHFATEEAVDSLAAAVQDAPRYHARAAALRAQHPDLAAEMSRIRARARGSTSVEGWADVQLRFTSLAALLRAHEEAEDDIVYESLLDDLGTVD
jgi:hypothetical protein